MPVRLGAMPGPVMAERIASEFGFLVRDREVRPERGDEPPSGLPAVAAVLRGGAAEAAGLRAGDVLVEVNGRPVLTLEATRQALTSAAVEASLPLVVSRDGEQMSLVITRSPRP
jgi:S1-C subfamily serine protease